MSDIIIYTKPERLLHKMGMLPVPDEADEAFGTDCEFYWRFERDIKNADKIKKIFFATKGFIIGYFKVNNYDDHDFMFDADQENFTLSYMNGALRLMIAHGTQIKKHY